MNPVICLYLDKLAVASPPDQVLGYLLRYLGATNTLILAFWESSGPSEVALAWTDGTFPSDATAQLHAAGTKILVSAGGGGSTPISDDPTGGAAYGTAVGQWAKAQGLDGVDFDIEDNDMFQNQPQTAIEWMVDATQAARDAFPEAIISHAPQAPYFSPVYGEGPYLSISQQVGSEIDRYNIQFYNQDSSSYDSFGSLFEESDGWATETAVAQLVAAGIPLSKIVVGKPVKSQDATNTGYVPVDDFAAFIEQATSQGLRPAGVMGWQLHYDQEGKDWSTTLAAAFSRGSK